jgi:hypothetical protein
MAHIGEEWAARRGDIYEDMKGMARATRNRCVVTTSSFFFWFLAALILILLYPIRSEVNYDRNTGRNYTILLATLLLSKQLESEQTAGR